MEPKILVKPTEKQYTALQDAFDLAFQAMPKELLIPCHALFALKGEAKKKIKKARPKTVTYFCPKCGATVKG